MVTASASTENTWKRPPHVGWLLGKKPSPESVGSLAIAPLVSNTLHKTRFTGWSTPSWYGLGTHNLAHVQLSWLSTAKFSGRKASQIDPKRSKDRFLQASFFSGPKSHTESAVILWNQAKQWIIIRKSLKIAIHWHYLIPPDKGNLMTTETIKILTDESMSAPFQSLLANVRANGPAAKVRGTQPWKGWLVGMYFHIFHPITVEFGMVLWWDSGWSLLPIPCCDVFILNLMGFWDEKLWKAWRPRFGIISSQDFLVLQLTWCMMMFQYTQFLF